jgi:hypothetical protein
MMNRMAQCLDQPAAIEASVALSEANDDTAR